jgi:hypothetical protein
MHREGRTRDGGTIGDPASNQQSQGCPRGLLPVKAVEAHLNPGCKSKNKSNAGISRAYLFFEILYPEPLD